MAAPRRGRAPAPLTPEPPAPAPATKGLDPFDRDRAGSLADEGGAAGAQVEGPGPDPRPDPPVPPEGDESERSQQRRLPGKDELPDFDDSGETPALPTRLRPAARGDGRK